MQYEVLFICWCCTVGWENKVEKQLAALGDINFPGVLQDNNRKSSS